MKIAIIGAGTVGESLARALAKAGHSVMLSSRNPNSDKMQSLVNSIGADAQAGTVAETLAFSDVVALAIRPDTLPDVVGASGNWAEKIVIDMMNRFDTAAADSAGSLAQDVATMTGARVVKALNTIGAEWYQDPKFGGQAASMLIAGDDAEAKQLVTGLLTELGFDVVDVGDLAATAHVENLATLWVHLAFRTELGRGFAFKIVKK